MTDNKLSAWRWPIGIPAFSPLLVAYTGTVAVLLGREGWQRVALVLVCCVLLANAAWLVRLLFDQTVGLVPSAVGVLCMFCVWLWQWRAFSILIPDGRLSYGYFLTPQGTTAHVWLLIVPFWTGTGLLALGCSAAMWWGYRKGLRLELLWMLPWWLAAFIVFSLPSAYFDGQGNASVFI